MDTLYIDSLIGNNEWIAAFIHVTTKQGIFHILMITNFSIRMATKAGTSMIQSILYWWRRIIYNILRLECDKQSGAFDQQY